MSRVGTPLRARSVLLAAVLLSTYVGGSEFPERECCNHSYPISEPTSRAPSSPTPIGRSGLDVKTANAILNCLFARQLCFEDSSCSAILEIIPRVCGPELVACSTVTVTKCQAALRTLQSFPYFRPTCLCREPHVDPECNSFRDFLFDHPCIYVLKKDEDPYLADNLLTCNHALGMCQREKACIKLFGNFKTNCKAREGKCRMESRDACHDAWTQLRLSPMFGCICPKNSMKRRCDRIFSMVNHNPCVEFLPSASVDLSGTDSALYPFDPQQENFQDLWLPPTSMYPYFLFPGTATARTFNGYELPELPGNPRKPVLVDPDRDFDLDRRPSADNDDRDQRARDGEQERENGPEGYGDLAIARPDADAGSSSEHDRVSSTEHLQHPHEQNEHDHPLYRHETKLHSHRHHNRNRDSLAPRSTPTLDGTNPAPPAPGKKFAPRPTYEHRAVVDRMDDDLDDNELRIGGGLPIDRLFDLGEAFEGFVDQVKVISHPDNSTSLELIESQMENPLIDADHQDLHVLKQFSLPGVHQHRLHQKRNQSREDRGRPGKPAIVSSSASVAERTVPLRPPIKPILSSTCHHAYASCKNDPECRTILQPILNHCDLTTCARNECMDALQHFYKTANHKHSMEIAFCLCKKTDSKRDECIVAQERMHPICAQRVEGTEMPTCHSLAEVCREERSCRIRLEYYEQSCAVDSLTKKCAGPTSECRKATMGILGTELRSNCACKGTDFTQLYDCLGWQRLLWVNPCVVESQKDYHARRKHHHHPKTTTTSISATKIGSTAVVSLEAVENNLIPEVTLKTSTEFTESWEIGTTSSVSTTPITTTTTTAATSTTTTTTTTSSTPRPRFCVVQRPRQSHQYIREGKGKRLYREDEPECSELCQCGEGEVLVCNTICVESSPCKTDFAFYNHAAPAYQAYRGRCLCYSGRFICMRPSPDTYSIPHGVFMFLGYSEADENLLRPHSNLTVLDAVSSLDSFMRQEVNNETVCNLFLYNVTRENVIAIARLGTDGPPLNSSQAQSLQHLLRVKEECATMLQELSEKINNRHQEVHTHPLLSIFKMAEVEIKLPYRSEGGAPRGSRFLLALILLACFLDARSGGSGSTSTLTLLIGDVVS